jgi:hypothetical protein
MVSQNCFNKNEEDLKNLKRKMEDLMGAYWGCNGISSSNGSKGYVYYMKNGCYWVSNGIYSHQNCD